ncbi:FAD dependent oxidoreductase family protein [Asticcacaulis biprosthecium C19]|uniref:FAD dependent oxidoreductase family protein n=1 Tax=Asticcacaulis biprosthecium C19 TaxID=715226 RepID=F4QS04_9CAUL|nr:FAD-dependent oxidoreductase [Asticcacaulis biprosthecium]EGF89524.1 FAD dependent oxidoreductase family protein [Asticcacaulis biprosthecium C19]
MARTPSSLIIVGGGIVGLTLAVAAKARGYAVTLLSRDTVEDTASGVAAGMIAPALEALNDPEPVASYKRLKAAQEAWFGLMEAWPQAVCNILRAAQQASSVYVWPPSDKTPDDVMPRLRAMGVAYQALADEPLKAVASDCDGVRVDGEMLLEARSLLTALADEVTPRHEKVITVSATSVILETGEVLHADAVVVAAGFASAALASDVPSLGHLGSIKGHILEAPGQGGLGVVRSPVGYFADYGNSAKFGATMEFGVDDLLVDPAVVASLKGRAREIMPALDLASARALTGLRAASPDGWPMIGRDGASGVYVATAMRRNGYIFAPLAARMILDLLDGEPPPELAMYDPNRF